MSTHKKIPSFMSYGARTMISVITMCIFFWAWPYRWFTKSNNCYFWTLEQLIKHGGTVEWQPARNWAGLHAVWVKPDGARREYVPRDHTKPWYRMLFFDGVVRVAKMHKPRS